MRRRAGGSATTRGCTAATGSKQATEALKAQGRRAGRGRAQPDRRGLGRPARSVEGAADRPARPTWPAIVGRETPRDRRLAGQAGRRRGGARRARFDRLGVQRPRPGRRRARRSRWLMRWSTPTAPPTCSSPARRSTPRSASTSAMASGCTTAPIRGRARRACRQDASPSIPSAPVAAIFEALDKAGAKIVAVRDPTVLPKAVKNPVEIAGHKAAQARDGAAIARFLRWVEDEAPKGDLDELNASDHLEALRREDPELRDLSFDTISGRRPERRDRPLPLVARRPTASSSRNSLYLVDSGGQYLDGTTDITRTVADRRADRGDARPLHPRAEGPHRRRHRAFPQGHARHASSTASPAGRCGKRASITPTAPATASAASCRSTKGRSASRRPAAPRRAATSRCRRA